MKDFKIEVSSDLDYEGMVVDISDAKGRIATISCDKGIENAEIIIFDSQQEKIIWELDYSSFQNILNKAFQKLKEANNLDFAKKIVKSKFEIDREC